MNAPLSERTRIFLVNWFYTSLYGISLSEWLRLLVKHRFAVDPPYLPRAALMTLTSSLTTVIGAYEKRKYNPKIEGVKVREPLFILGHWRSGTTYLHRLLATDERFTYPNVWQALNPHTFLSTERHGGILKFAGPKTRVIDDMSLDAGVPLEDEFAPRGTLCSPFLRWTFPRWTQHYDRYLTFRDVPEEEVERWKAALLLFYKKLTWKSGRPLLLKSPPHTARVGLLLEMFPEARFVHIHRNPYAVFRSTRAQVPVMEKTIRLQNPRRTDLDARIIHRYRQMYDAFFEERDLIPSGRFHEVCFEELEQDPVGEVRKVYEHLGIPGFEEFEPVLKRYVGSISGYRKNEYPDLPSSLHAEISRVWKRSFDE